MSEPDDGSGLLKALLAVREAEAAARERDALMDLRRPGWRELRVSEIEESFKEVASSLGASEGDAAVARAAHDLAVRHEAQHLLALFVEKRDAADERGVERPLPSEVAERA